MAAVAELNGSVDLSDRRPFGVVKKGFTRFKNEDLIVAKITPSMENGKAAVVRGLEGGIGCGSTEFHVIRSECGVEPDYLRYFVTQSGFRQEAKQNMQGAVGQQRVPAGFIRDAVIPVAPSLEQQRIVSKIEELFSSIAEGERALEQVRKLVQHYRQSVLKAAVTGELTREWREKHAGELESGESLLTRILEARRKAWEKSELDKMRAKGQRPVGNDWKKRYKKPVPPDTSQLPEAPKGWVWVNFDHVSECLDFARVPINRTVRATRRGDVPYYGANGQVGTIDQFLFDEPLVLVVEDETFTGRTKPFSYKIEGKSWVNNHAHILRPTNETNIDFLNAVLMRYPFIPLTKGTTARRKLTQQSLMSAPVAVPSIAEQEQIVAAIEDVFSSLCPVEVEAENAATVIRGLRQTILREAFLGTLVPQDADDESASILLERIAAERVASPKRVGTKPVRKKKVKA